MSTRRLGCLTPLGLLGVLVTILAIAAAGWTQGGAIFSPGALNARQGNVLGGVRSHAETGGDCAACHTAPWDPTSMTVRCLDCHTGVESELADPTTLHGGLIDHPEKVNCRDCHTEHHGPEAMLTRLDLEDFPHQVTGFSLQAHAAHPQGAPFRCDDCHRDDFTRLDPSVCEECHLELDEPYQVQHNIAFGKACLNCHDGIDTIASTFTHETTGFPLLGKHAAADCQRCHQSQTTLAALQNTAAGCSDCHASDDPHDSKLGADCASCHDPQGWTPTSFDHNTRTGFVLTGEHVEVQCTACHANNSFEGTPQTCAGCHTEDDAHQGRFGSDCAACHTPTAWKPSTFDHAKTSFQLEGKHTQVECLDCHLDGAFKGTPQTCTACHSGDDAHQGQLGTDCASCHTAAGWVPSTFDHARAAFQLTGAHQSAACASCHVNGKFKGISQTCAGCHSTDDAHNGEFGADCAACHTTSAWVPSTFDHARAAFQLTGAHQSVSCNACHTGGKFKGTPQSCAACHSADDKHNGQFGSDCAACHTTSRWSDVTFNHANTGFPLTGAHVALPCLQCHSGGSFSGTPTACVACHAEPSAHAGMFGTNCAICHSTSAWLPAGYNGPHTFPMNHGGANSCRDCHTGALTSWTCYTCHNQGEIANKHNEEGIGDFSNCLRCHANGEEGDDGGGDGGGDGDDD